MQYIFQQITFVLPAACQIPLVSGVFACILVKDFRQMSEKIELIKN